MHHLAYCPGRRSTDGGRGRLWRVLVGGLLLAGWGSWATSGEASTANALTPSPAAINEVLGIDAGTLQVLFFDSHPDTGVLSTQVQFGNETYTLELTRHSLRADDFQVWVVDTAGVHLHPTPPIVTWRGTVAEWGESLVRARYENRRLSALVAFGGETWTVEPLADHGLVGLPGQHVVYRAEDVLPHEGQCGVTTFVLEPQGAAAPFGAAEKVCDIGLDADFNFYQLNGSSVAATVNDMEAIINGVEGIYDEPGLGIRYEITVAVVRTVTGAPYTSTEAGTLLDQFQGAWNASPFSNIRSDVAHLFTGKNIDGTTIGIASLTVICSNNNQYGLSQSRFSSNMNSRLALTAHELGHNWSAQHCNGQSPCRIMCATLGGCNGLSPLTFGTVSVNSINNHKNTRSCLSDYVPPTTLPFFDDFESGLVNTRWNYNDGGSVVTSALGEPSGTQSLNLDATGSQTYQTDEIRSNKILMAGVSNIVLSYHTQHRGVESGEALVIEYLNNALDWVEIHRVISSGVDQTGFVQHMHVLPPNAAHNQFRLRFRTEVNATNDDWYLDDVSVSSGPITPDPPLLASIQPSSGSTAGGTVVTVTGQDFAANAVVFIGSQPLLGVAVVNSTQITGIVPPGLPGPSAVSISQSSGSDVLQPGFEYVLAQIRIESTTVLAGASNNNVGILADHSFDLAGYSLGVTFDGTYLQLDSVTVGGTLADEADFVAPSVNNSFSPSGSFGTLGVVLDLSPPLDLVIPHGFGNLIAMLSFTASANIPLSPHAVIVDTGLGVPPVDLTLVDPLGVSIVPDALPGILTPIQGNPFIRGDANMDGMVNIADAVRILEYLFTGGSVPCLEAVDANDDGNPDIADAVRVLGYLFQSQSPPPAPFPSPGLDPTPDNLECLPAP